MGWGNYTTFSDTQSRWPFSFLFKKAIGAYESYEYLVWREQSCNMTGDVWAEVGIFQVRPFELNPCRALFRRR